MISFRRVPTFAEPILHVDMDAFFVEVERLRRPDLRGVPVAVGATTGRGVVASASYEARGRGVHSAMPVSHARRLVPGLIVVAPDHGEYRRLSELVFEILRSVTPAVEGVSIDEAYLDVSGLRLHVSSPEEVGLEIRSRVRGELGLPASVGIGSNKLIAKLASESAKPDGLKLVKLEGQADFLEPLPVGALPGVGSATGASLRRLGVETVADLRSVPLRSLESALGGALAAHLSNMAMGIDVRNVTPESEARSISTEETFSRDVSNRAELAARLSVQSGRVAARARRAGVSGRTVTLKLRLADFTTVSRSLTLRQAGNSTAEIDRAAQSLLARLDWGQDGVRLIGVGLSHLVDAGQPRQLSFGEDGRTSRLDEVLDEIRERFKDGPGIDTGRNLGTE